MSQSKERVFKVKEFLNIIHLTSYAFPLLKEAKKQKAFSKQLKERIMLSVTNVNGCALCSYVHTKIALKSGMDIKEIKALLGGEKDSVSEEELIAVLFAEHFASSKESPDDETVKRLIQTYGEYKADLIIAACIMISLTNVIGITMHLMKNRLLFHRDKRSSFLGELTILMLIPYAGLRLFLGRFFRNPKNIKLTPTFM